MSITRSSAVSAWGRLLGTRSDWQLHPRSVRRPRPTVAWLGPLIMLGSILVSWPAFDGTIGEEGEGSAALGLYVGAVSIQLMAWSFLLAVRVRPLEPLFGGLHSMYRAHRWAGALAVATMFWHTSLEPEVEGGIRGASRSVADAATDLAGAGQMFLYVLVGMSLLRWIPYRWWRWTHKFLGVPFAFASWHFYTAEKPYANGSGWGWWFGVFMVTGLVAYLIRVIGRDVVAPGFQYRVAEAVVQGTILELTLAPLGAPLSHAAGRFAAIKVQVPGLTEPHMFTIASSPETDNLTFFIRDLGDWTDKMHRADLVGKKVIVEGPYGRFEPHGKHKATTVWIAGGVGITPFLSAVPGLPVVDAEARPTLFYCVRSVEDAVGLDALRAAEAQGRLKLVICSTSTGTRFSRSTLVDHYGEQGLRDAHVAVCGPASLVATAHDAALSVGATRVEREDFDMRQGFGPDLSRDIEQLTSRLSG